MTIHQNKGPKDPLSIQLIAHLMNVSRCGYYKWLQQSDSNPNHVKIDMHIKDELQKIAVDYPVYSHRRMTAELRRQRYHPNHKRVFRLMRKDNTRPNKVCASNITYIQLISEFNYLAVILDLYTRKCIHWERRRNIDTQLTMSALDNALKDRWDPHIKGLIHHSDQQHLVNTLTV